MATKDFIASRLGFAIALAPAARNATANGTGVSLSNYGAIGVVFASGVITDGTHTPKLQESNDNSTWNDVAAQDQVGTLANLASNAVQKVA